LRLFPLGLKPALVSSEAPATMRPASRETLSRSGGSFWAAATNMDANAWSRIEVNSCCLAKGIPRLWIIASGGGISVEMCTDLPMISYLTANSIQAAKNLLEGHDRS